MRVVFLNMLTQELLDLYGTERMPGVFPLTYQHAWDKWQQDQAKQLAVRKALCSRHAECNPADRRIAWAEDL